MAATYEGLLQIIKIAIVIIIIIIGLSLILSDGKSLLSFLKNALEGMS